MGLEQKLQCKMFRARLDRERLNLSSQTVFLTGGSGGIGKSIENKLLTEGYNIIAPPREELNLADLNSISEYVGKHENDPIDILINNAAINPATALDEMTPELIEEVLRVDVTAPLLLTRGLTSHMKEKGWGRVINISSIWGVRGREGRSVYSAAKHALNGMTSSLARELGSHNILVNSVCPGFVDTEMTRRNLTPEQLAELLKKVPLGRLAQPDEIADVVAFLVSKKNTFITGQSIIVDGGFTV